MKIQIILWTVQLIHKRLCQANLKNVPVQHYTAIINRFHFHSQKCKLRSKPKKISFFYYYNSLLYNSCAFLIFFNHVQITQEASFVIWLYIDAKIQLQVGLLMYHIQHTWPSLYFIFTNTNSFLPGLHELFWYLQLNSNHCHYCPRLLHSQKSTWEENTQCAKKQRAGHKVETLADDSAPQLMLKNIFFAPCVKEGNIHSSLHLSKEPMLAHAFELSE